MNYCVDCEKEIGSVSKRCNSCSAKKLWKTPKFREKMFIATSNAQNKRYENPKERKKQSIAMKKVWKDPKYRENQVIVQSIAGKKRYKNPKEREKLSIISKKSWENSKRRKEMSVTMKKRWEDPIFREKQSRRSKEYWKDSKHKEKQSIIQKKYWENLKNREKHSRKMKEYFKNLKNRKEQSSRLKEAWKNPSNKMLLHLNDNGYGIKCFSDDGLHFLSFQERDCYYWLKYVLKMDAKKFGRFDFIINNSIVLEYHPCNWFLEERTYKQYYKDRRKLLDKLGHNDLKLVVMTNLSDKEKNRIKKEIQ